MFFILNGWFIIEYMKKMYSNLVNYVAKASLSRFNIKHMYFLSDADAYTPT